MLGDDNIAAFTGIAYEKVSENYKIEINPNDNRLRWCTIEAVILPHNIYKFTETFRYLCYILKNI